MSWNRLTNCEREELCELPVWTTEEDRRGALSYADHPLEGALEAVRALSTGATAPRNLGLLVAVARYEDAGWMPDGCFERWRRWVVLGTERLDVAALVQWLDTHEGTMQRKLRDLEKALTHQCQQQEKSLAMAQSEASLAYQRLHAHHQKLILARLSIDDTAGAREIAQRMPAGPARNEIDKILRAHSALPRTTEHDTSPDIHSIVHRLHMSSEREPDVRAVPMRLIHQDVFDELLAATDAIPASRLPTKSPTLEPDDLTDADVKSLDMCNAQGASLTESDQQRVGHKIERAIAELRRHRCATQATCPAVSEGTTTKNLTDQHMSDLLSGYSGVAGTDVIERLVHEIRRRGEDARELTERRQLDAGRRAEIEELVARRQADLCAEERTALTGLKQLMESAAYRAHKDRPVLTALVDRLLGAQ